MRVRRFGVVLNISSRAGLDGGEGLGVYAAAKAAGDGMFSFWFLVHCFIDLYFGVLCLLTGVYAI
jgi:hypothetical protein